MSNHLSALDANSSSSSCIFFNRYRISGSSLLAAMDQSSHVPYTDVLSVQPGDLGSTHLDEKEQSDGSSCSQVSDETLSRLDDRAARVHPTVDVAEIIRRWTHALQRIHKQSLQLVCWFPSTYQQFTTNGNMY